MLSRSIDIASDAVFWIDENARFVYVNRSACLSVGYEQKELLALLSLFANHAAIATENARLREGLKTELAERKRREGERLDLERRMLAAQKLEGLGLLAGGVAHDFNNLLAVILGYAEMLKNELPEVSDAATSVREIIMAAVRSRDLTRQLLAIGRQQSLMMEPLDLNQVILNLAVNAQDAMPQGGQLSIETREETLDEAFGCASRAENHG